MTRMSSTGTPKAEPIGSPMQEVLSLLRPLGQKELAPPERTGTTAASTAAKQTDKVSRLSFHNRNFLGQEPVLAVNGNYVPYNVFDGDNLKNRNLMLAEKFKDGKTEGGPNSLYSKGMGNPKTRLPRTNGKWDGELGNGKWYSDKPKVKSVTNGKGLEFIDGRPNFTPWSKGSIKFKEGMLDGSKSDFNLVYEKIMQLKGFRSQNQAKFWLKEKGLTPHHKSSTEIELIPTDLHANIPHIGSALDLRGGK